MQSNRNESHCWRFFGKFLSVESAFRGFCCPIVLLKFFIRFRHVGVNFASNRSIRRVSPVGLVRASGFMDFFSGFSDLNTKKSSLFYLR